jgi:hypothetical protein
MQVEWLGEWRGMQGDMVEGEVMGGGQSMELNYVSHYMRFFQSGGLNTKKGI